MNVNIYVFKPFKDRQLKALAMWLVLHRIHANMITIAGLLLGGGAAFFLLNRQPGMGLFLLGLSIGADLLDGPVARLENGIKLSGKLLDSFCDRLVEFAWIAP